METQDTGSTLLSHLNIDHVHWLRQKIFQLKTDDKSLTWSFWVQKYFSVWFQWFTCVVIDVENNKTKILRNGHIWRVDSTASLAWYIHSVTRFTKFTFQKSSLYRHHLPDFLGSPRRVESNVHFAICLRLKSRLKVAFFIGKNISLTTIHINNDRHLLLLS